MWCIHRVELTWLLLGKKLRFILPDEFYFHMIEHFSIAIGSRSLMSFSVDEMLLPRYHLLNSFREPSFSVEMSPSCLKIMYSVLSTFTLRSMPSATCFRLFSRDKAYVCVFARSAVSSAWSASVIVCVGFRLLLAFRA